MYFDDFIADQVMRTNDDRRPSRIAGTQPSGGHAFRTLWRGLRQFAWGVDAFSSVTHGRDVPPDHPARQPPSRTPAARDLDDR